MADPSNQTAVIIVTVEESDDYPESLVYASADSVHRIYAAPDLNLTPVQSQHILKLRTTSAPTTEFRDSEGQLFATVVFDDSGDALLSYFAPAGDVVWTLTVSAEHAVPDAPAAIYRLNFRYRWLPLAFGLFLFVVTAFILITPVAGADFVARAGIAFVLAVVGIILVLQAIHRHMQL
ncbi:MAG TPA: hypothetical protein VGK19_24125 [Capsulimonadaceae bacterium]|jgi:hypothetical protein